MIEVLRQSHTLRLPGNAALSLAKVRALSGEAHEYLHAEAVEVGSPGPQGEGEAPSLGAGETPALPDGTKRIAVVFGPEDGAIDSQLVFEAAREAYFLKFDALYLFGFAIQAKARELVADRKRLRLLCVYVAVTPDVVMSDLLKTSKSSEVFSVTGLPDVRVHPAGTDPTGAPLYRVELLGLDTFRPHDLETESVAADNLPCWMLDAGHGLQRHGLHGPPGLLPQDRGLGQPGEVAPRALRRWRLGAPGRDPERALRREPPPPGRRQGDRRAGQ
jgi:adenine-specific DNA-methyltransferase